jgi:hypothetical protein
MGQGTNKKNAGVALAIVGDFLYVHDAKNSRQIWARVPRVGYISTSAAAATPLNPIRLNCNLLVGL